MIGLDQTLLQQECSQMGLPWRVRLVEEIPSTSDDLREAAQRGEPGNAVLFAESQTAGRGRRDNRWVASRGQDLMISLLLRPEAPISLWPRLTTLAALAVCCAVEDELPLKPQIKWPNDVYVDGRKVSGLLAEAVGTPQGMALILGIGLNVNRTEFPPELAETATSLLPSLPPGIWVRELDRNQLALRLLQELDRQFLRVDQDFIAAVADVRQRSWLLGKQIRAISDGVEVYGRAQDLSPEGHLVLALPNGTLRILASAEGVRQVISL